MSEKFRNFEDGEEKNTKIKNKITSSVTALTIGAGAVGNVAATEAVDVSAHESKESIVSEAEASFEMSAKYQLSKIVELADRTLNNSEMPRQRALSFIDKSVDGMISKLVLQEKAEATVSSNGESTITIQKGNISGSEYIEMKEKLVHVLENMGESSPGAVEVYGLLVGGGPTPTIDSAWTNNMDESENNQPYESKKRQTDVQHEKNDGNSPFDYRPQKPSGW